MLQILSFVIERPILKFVVFSIRKKAFSIFMRMFYYELNCFCRRAHLFLNSLLGNLKCLAEGYFPWRVEQLCIECSWESDCGSIVLIVLSFYTNHMTYPEISESFTNFLWLAGIYNYEIKFLNVVLLHEFSHLLLVEEMSQAVIVFKN